MALLDFQCEACGKKFFELVGFSDKDKVKCPNCASKDIKQIFEGSSSFGTNIKANKPHR